MNDNRISSYINEEFTPFHFCPGCGHATILHHLSSALEQLQVDSREIVIVTDIGCSGLSDKYFKTNAFHGLHGRSITYATGIKLANPNLKVIVLMGDGGCGIGGNHLISAARRNIGIFVLVFNNFNFGMTGGQHSVTTPAGMVTATTKNGNLEYPMDICSTVASNGGSFVARTTTYNKKLTELFVEALNNHGFSLIDIWELCTAYFGSKNKLNKKRLEETLSSLDFPQGILKQDSRQEFSAAYRESVIHKKYQIPLKKTLIEIKYQNSLLEEIQCLIAGQAGMRIGSAATAFSIGAMMSGIWISQRNDYPVTVRSGYSIASVILSHQEIFFPVSSKPNLMVVLFKSGMEKVRSQISMLTEKDVLFINSELLPVKTKARIEVLNLHQSGQKRDYWAYLALADLLRKLKIYPIEAYREAVSLQSPFVKNTITVV
jgi:2-oxoglutarate ferredoxin oxidoreductase subunit beta